jgi:hypothetical protein
MLKRFLHHLLQMQMRRLVVILLIKISLKNNLISRYSSVDYSTFSTVLGFHFSLFQRVIFVFFTNSVNRMVLNSVYPSLCAVHPKGVLYRTRGLPPPSSCENRPVGRIAHENMICNVSMFYIRC